MSKDDVHV